MKMFRMFGRYIRDAFKSVTRNFSLSIAAISCISITLIIVGLSLLMSFNVNNFTKTIEEDVTIVVFLDKETTEEEATAVGDKIRQLSNIDKSSEQSVVFKSKEQEKQEMMAESDVFDSIMSTWEEVDNPLRDSYLVKVVDINEIKSTVDQIKRIDKVGVVDYGEGMIEQLVSSFSLVEKIALIIVIILVIVTIFLIINTIKLTIFSRQREISIMRLVGASNLTIKVPFIIEGMFIGIIGSIVPMIVIIYGYYAFYDHFGGQLFSALIKLVSPEPFVYLVSIIVLLIGALVGMIGSGRAVRKYLKI